MSKHIANNMKIDIQSKQHLSAGSYIDLVLAAVVMQIIFFTTTIWFGTIGSEYYILNGDEVRYTIRMQIGLGWMMCIIACLGFGILPLIYDVKTFEKSVMRTYLTMNIFGQLAISLGIISQDVATYQTLATIGMTLLCSSLICLGPSALVIFKNKKVNQDKMGPFSNTIGTILPILGLFTLSCWIGRKKYPALLDYSELLVLDFFIPLAVVAIIISHVNRRLDWEIIKSENLTKVFVFFTILLLLAIIGGPLSERGDISSRLYSLLLILPYISIFIIMRPLKILSYIKQKKPYNRMVLTALFWIPFVGIAAFLENAGYVTTNDNMMAYSRWIIIFGVASQALWGFTIYLHDDHKKLSIHRRKTNWLIYSSLNLGSLITFLTMIVSWKQGELIDEYPRTGIFLYVLSFVLISLYWIKDIFFSLDDWHKVPMYYDQYLEYPKEGSGFEPE